MTCTYELGIGAPVDGTNVARASYAQDGVNLAFQGSAGILEGDFVETLIGDPIITVDDDNLEGEDWSASAASAFWEYTKTYECSADPAAYSGRVLLVLGDEHGHHQRDG